MDYNAALAIANGWIKSSKTSQRSQVVAALIAGPPVVAFEPKGGTILMQDLFRDIAKWAVVQQSGFNGPPKDYIPTYRLQTNTAVGGARFELREGDIPPFGGGERTELQSNITVREGDERWFSFDMCAERGAPVGWGSVLWQIHPNSSTGSPPLCLMLTPDRRLALCNNQPGAAWSVDLGPVGYGDWNRWTIHAKFDRTARGLAEIYKDGKRLASVSKPTLNADAGGYMKLGIYRATGGHETQVVIFDQLLVTSP